MSVVNLHPDSLFDALRAGTLTKEARAQLDAHCARCSACLFELRCVEAPLTAAEPSAEDRAYGEAAFDNVLRAARRPKEAQPAALRPTRTLWRWGIGALLLGTSVGIALLTANPFAAKPPPPALAPQQPVTREPAPTQPEASPVPSSPRIEVAPSAQPGPQPSAAGAPSANALLAAARLAQTRAQPDRAQSLYREVIARYPTTPAAGASRVALGRLLDDQLGQPKAALPLFDSYLRLHPGGELAEEALYYRAHTLERLGRTRRAVADLRRLVSSFPNSLYAAPARARLARERGE